MPEETLRLRTTEVELENILGLIGLLGKHYGLGEVNKRDGNYFVGETAIDLTGIGFEDYEKRRYEICSVVDEKERTAQTTQLELKKLGGYLGGYLRMIKNAA